MDTSVLTTYSDFIDFYIEKQGFLKNVCRVFEFFTIFVFLIFFCNNLDIDPNC